MVFSEQIKRPNFLVDIGIRRRLVELSNVDVTRDLFNIELDLFGFEAQQNLTYTVEMTAWEADRIKLFINFSDPLLISQEIIKDKLRFSFKDPSFFAAKGSPKFLSNDTLP